MLIDEAQPDGVGHLLLAASHASTAAIGFMVEYTTGILYAPISEDRCRALELLPMVANAAEGDAICAAVQAGNSGSGVNFIHTQCTRSNSVLRGRFSNPGCQMASGNTKRALTYCLSWEFGMCA